MFTFRILILIFNIQGALTALAITVLPLLQNTENLPVKIWLPFDTNGYIYWLNVIYEAFCLLYAAGIAINFDCLLISLLTKSCSQLNVLVKRFEQFCIEIEEDRTNKECKQKIYNKENDFFKNFIEQHQLVYE